MADDLEDRVVRAMKMATADRIRPETMRVLARAAIAACHGFAYRERTIPARKKPSTGGIVYPAKKPKK